MSPLVASARRAGHAGGKGEDFHGDGRAGAGAFSLAGETALVTGASSGFGARFARTLAANGARVVLAARRRARLEVLAAQIAASGGQALAVEADATDEAAMTAAFDAAEAAFGTVTILVANAGTALAARAVETTPQQWRATMALNLDAPFMAAQIAARRMIAQERKGAIVMTSSITAGMVERGMAAYAVSKAALAQLTRALALEWGPRGVRVNALAPGYVATRLNADFLNGPAGTAMAKRLPLRRLGQAEDLDGALLLLAARGRGAWITGTLLVADGGHLLVGGG
ncbi:MAG: SDR family oxidoreductase [Rhodoblastus sp.]|nr:MAG: SDR family oxidoreductase [Rhodoblastus sp.]